MENTRKKNTGGLEGMQFQLKLLTVCLLNALGNKIENWTIEPENGDGGKFDDIIIKLPKGAVVLVQAKLKQNLKMIGKRHLLTSNNSKNDFSLPKYLICYENIKNNFGEKKTCIICTNVNVDQHNLKILIERQDFEADNLLHYKENECGLFKFTKHIHKDLKAKVQQPNEEEMSDDTIEACLDNLFLLSNYSRGEKLNKVIEQLLSRLEDSTLFCEIPPLDIYRKVEHWFLHYREKYLKKDDVEAMCCEIKSDKYCQSLNDYKAKFVRRNFNLTNSTKVFLVTTKCGYFLQVLKIFHSLPNDTDKKLFVDPNQGNDPLVQRHMIEAFKLPRYKYLVMAWNETAEEMVDGLRQTLENSAYKKVILISDDNTAPTQSIGLEAEQLDNHIEFEDLAEDSQEILLKRKNIIFQGQTISVKELFASQMTESYTKHLNTEIMEKLIKNEKIDVGKRPLEMDRDIARYYIDRTFRRLTNDESDTSGNNEEAISVDNIYEVAEKMVLITNCAGMGKTTILTELGVAIKKKYPYLWVIRINLMDYANILRDSQKKIDITMLLNSQDATKLDKCEESIFSVKNKVALLLDGVDEVVPDCSKSILDLLTQCQNARNFDKIIITTRPHVVEDIKNEIKVALYEMVPFSIQNQTEFLKTYWIHTLRLDNTKINKCEEYAKELLDKMPSWTKSYHEDIFTKVPLHLKIIANIFLERSESTDCEGCREYARGDGVVPVLPEKFNITTLYGMFFEEIRETFVRKQSSNGSSMLKQSLKNEFTTYHHTFALTKFLGKPERDLFSIHRSNDNNMEFILKMGLVQRICGTLQFVHVRVAEYCFAKVIIKELESGKSTIKFQKLLLDEILVKPKFKIIRYFLNNFLQAAPLPDGIFENYKRKYKKYGLTDAKIVFVASGEGCVEILRLVFESINFNIKMTRNTETNPVRYLINKLFELLKLFSVRETNTLKELQKVMQKFGVNIKHKTGWAPIHYAIKRNHLETVQFLIERGADLTIRDTKGRTALELAEIIGNLDAVKSVMNRRQ